MKLRVLIAGLEPLGSPIVDSSHQLARAFARLGHEVLHISTPVTPGHLARLASPAVRRRFRLAAASRRIDGVREFVPFALVPSWVTARVDARTNLMLATTVPPIRRRLHRLGFSAVDLLVIEQPLFFGLWIHVDCARLVYRPIDVFPLLMANPLVRRLERRILGAASGVVSASLPVAEHVRALSPYRLPELVLPNGVEYEHFAAPAPLPLEYAAALLPRVHFVLVGPGRPPTGARRAANLHCLGPRPYVSVPGYLQHAAVGLLPLGEHPANRGRSPMKLYESLAAGLPVAARDTPELRRRELPFVHLYAAPADFPRLVERLLGEPPDATGARAVAREHAWSRLGERDRNPATPVKMYLGLAQVALGFIFLVIAVFEMQRTADMKSGMIWLVLGYLFHTTGELCISPVGLSMVTKLAPLRLGSLMMGVWFMINFVANTLAGYIGAFTETMGEYPWMISLAADVSVRAEHAGLLGIFGGLAVVLISFSLLLWAISGRIVQWMHGAEGNRK